MPDEIGGEILTTISVTILHYLEEKLMKKLLKIKTIQNEPIWVLFCAFCDQLWAKINFLKKKELSQFLDIPIIHHCAKNQKKILTNF